MRILIVEDSETIGEGIRLSLISRGDSADLVKSLAEARNFLTQYDYDLAVLDLNLPDGNGLELMPDLRQCNSAPAVLVLSAQSSLSDRVAGLDAGAEDYLTKPFELEELLARLRVLARRRQGERGGSKRIFADLKLDTARQQASISDQELILSRREFSCLKLLIDNADSVVTKTTILDQIYESNEPPLENAIEVLISRIRKKIAASKSELKTIRGVGYILVQKT